MLVEIEKSPCIDKHKKSLVQHLNRYKFVCLGPLMTIYPVIVQKTLKKYF